MTCCRSNWGPVPSVSLNISNLHTRSLYYNKYYDMPWVPARLMLLLQPVDTNLLQSVVNWLMLQHCYYCSDLRQYPQYSDICQIMLGLCSAVIHYEGLKCFQSVDWAPQVDIEEDHINYQPTKLIQPLRNINITWSLYCQNENCVANKTSIVNKFRNKQSTK